MTPETAPCIGDSTVHIGVETCADWSRAHFLDALVTHVPDGVTHFSKHLDTITEQQDGTVKLTFHDGTDATADAGASPS